MPEIASPNAFGMKTLYELSKNGFNAVAHMSEIAWIRLFLMFGRFVGSQEIEPITLQALRQVWFPVIAVCQNITSDALH
jgi:hypothetical protein